MIKLTVAVIFVSCLNFGLSSPLRDDLVVIDDKPCKFWPNVSKLTIECCSVPELFSKEIKESCIANCTHPKDPSFNSWCCTTNCIFEGTEIAADGKFNPENAKEQLSKVFEDDEKMVNVLDEVIDNCDARATELDHKPTTGDAGKVDCETPQFGYILSCIHQELFKACPEVKKDAECKEIKEFMERCPAKRPPLKQNKKSHTKPMRDNLADAIKDIIKNKTD